MTPEFDTLHKRAQSKTDKDSDIKPAKERKQESFRVEHELA